jgi:uncharacterized coiled-coil DUF342 family protein
MDSAHRLLLKQSLDQIDQLREQAEALDQEIARLFTSHQAANQTVLAHWVALRASSLSAYMVR